MNKFYHFNNLVKGFIFILLFFSFSVIVSAQTGSKLPEAQKFIEKNRAKYNLEKEDVSELRISSEIQDDNTGITHLYLQQQINSIDVVGSSMGVHFKDGEVKHFTTRFEKETAKRKTADTPSISAGEALLKVKKELNLPLGESISIVKNATGKNQSMTFSKGNIAASDIPVKLVYQKNNEDKLALTWQVELYEINHQHYWMMWIDAETGKIIEKRDLVLSCDFGGSAMATDAPASVHRHHNHSKNTNYNMTPAIPKAANSFENMFTVASSYRVYDIPVEAPNEPGAAQTDAVTDGLPAASPYGWHSTDGSSFNAFTSGNNVQARNDLGPASPPGTLPSHFAITTNAAVIPPFEFHYDADLTMGPETYTDAAIVNLFYWNNIVHDIFYKFGFDEKNGNFQTTNIFNGTDKGGLGSDAVIAEAQDGEGTNNANMLTLPDGTPPRMQMYLWSSSPAAELVYVNTVNGLPSTDNYQAIEAAFGTGNELDATGDTGDLVLIDANSAAPGTDDEGCGTGQGAGLIADNVADLFGNIALIKRGSCAFIEKIMSAQLSGATAVIVYNNIPGAPPISMGGAETGNLITIPAVMVSFEDGQALLANMATGTVNLTLARLTPAPPMKDGDFDNGIIAHEYGHGISNRLTGGPGALGPLGGDEQGGEGWSDYFALYLTTQNGDLGAPTTAHPNGVLPNRGIGTYVITEDITGGGIRPAKYSTDFSVNDYTYADVTNSEITIPHGIGFIWCTMLNEMTQEIIDIVPVNNDPYNNGKEAGAGGNNIALRLITEGLKLQPTSPTFVEMRDAILQADELVFDSQYKCAIWEAFARRGLGFQATSGSNAVGDEFENFDLPLECGGGMNAILEMEKSSIGVLENGGDITFTITVTNRSEIYPGTNVVITDNLSPNMSFVAASNGGTHNAGVVTFPAIATLAPGATETVTVTVNINTPGALTDLVFNDDVESGGSNWTPSPGLGAWTMVSDRTFSGTNSWFGEDQDVLSNQTLTLANSIVVPAGLQLSFFHEYATESGFDGGVVEISNDNGVTWIDLGANMIQNPYNSTIAVTDNPFLGGGVFDGANGKFDETVVDLNSYTGDNILIRFRIACDYQAFVDGWWIDDIRMFVNPVYETNNVSLTANGGLTASASAKVLMLESTTPLPVELVKFEATAMESSIQLDWTTETEVDAKGFIIERSGGGSDEFIKIGFENARGGTERTNYSYLDNNVRKNVDYYYRLKVVDTDNSFEYSAIRFAKIKGTETNDWTIQPNPTRDNVSIIWENKLAEPSLIRIVNIQGQVVKTYSTINMTDNVFNMDVSNLPSNIYFLQVQSGQSLETQKLIIQK